VAKLKKVIASFRFIKNLRNYFRSRKLAKTSPGQITINSESGRLLHNFISNNEIVDILEIGTYNGLGTTKLILDAMKAKNTEFNFTSIESDKIFYKEAVKNLKSHSNLVNIKLGRIIEINELPDIESIEFEKHGLTPANKEWYIQDLRRYKKIKNIFSELPNYFDFIVFDGGEFCTFQEFIKLSSKTKYFALDDINTYKQYEVLKYISENTSRFVLLENSSTLSIYKVI
tara:strand:- start:493 stop:1179 length:687 start_codon:yes stop_codon:yes gene_type:complete